MLFDWGYSDRRSPLTPDVVVYYGTCSHSDPVEMSESLYAEIPQPLIPQPFATAAAIQLDVNRPYHVRSRDFHDLEKPDAVNDGPKRVQDRHRPVKACLG